MNVMEIFSRGTEGFNDESSDESIKQKIEPRKTTLRLSQINSLRKMNDIREIESKNNLEISSKQYAKPPEAMGGLGM